MQKWRWETVDSRAASIVSCWLAVAIISSVYMWVFGDELGDVLFGVFVPVGLLVLVAIGVTFGVASGFETEKKRDAISSSDLRDIRSKLDAITGEIEQIKKEMEE